MALNSFTPEKGLNGASHTRASSPRLMYRKENFISVRNLATVPAFVLRYPKARGYVVKELISVPHDNYLESIYVHIAYF